MAEAVLFLRTFGNATDREQFRNTTRQLFRTKLIAYLNEHYTFWQVTPVNESIENFVQRYFWALRGQMYRPSNLSDSIILAEPVSKSFIPPEFTDAQIEPYQLA